MRLLALIILTLSLSSIQEANAARRFYQTLHDPSFGVDQVQFVFHYRPWDHTPRILFNAYEIKGNGKKGKIIGTENTNPICISEATHTRLKSNSFQSEITTRVLLSKDVTDRFELRYGLPLVMVIKTNLGFEGDQYKNQINVKFEGPNAQSEWVQVKSLNSLNWLGCDDFQAEKATAFRFSTFQPNEGGCSF